MCRLRNIAGHDYQQSVTTGETDRRTDRQTLDKVISMCRYALQATTQKRDFWTDRPTDRPTDRQTDRPTDKGQSDPKVPVCFVGDITKWMKTITS